MDDLEFEILMDRKKNNENSDNIADLAKLALSSSLVGGTLGGVSKAISGAKSFKSLLRPAGKGAAIGAALALSGGTLGKLLRSKDENDPNTNAKQVASGMGVIGALGGGGIGALLAQKYGQNSNQIKNLAMERLKKMTSKNFGNSQKSFIRKGALKAGTLKSAALGAGLGGLAGLFYGADEGSALDIFENSAKRRQKFRGEIDE